MTEDTSSNLIKYYCYTCHANFYIPRERVEIFTTSSESPICFECQSEFVEQTQYSDQYSNLENSLNNLNNSASHLAIESSSEDMRVDEGAQSETLLNSIDSTPLNTCEESLLPESSTSGITSNPEFTATSPLSTQHSQTSPIIRTRMFVSPFRNISTAPNSAQSASLTFLIDDPEGLLTTSLDNSANPQTVQRQLIENVMNSFLSNLNSSGVGNSQPSDLFSGAMGQVLDFTFQANGSQGLNSTVAAIQSTNSRRRPRSDSNISDSEIQHRRRSPRFTSDMQVPLNTSNNSPAISSTDPVRATTTNNFSDLIRFATEIFGSFFRSPNAANSPTSNSGTETPNPETSMASESEAFRTNAQSHRFQFIPINIFPNGLFGDYVTNDRSFDDIITHLLEQEALRHKPPSASEETISKLLRTKISSDYLEKHIESECIICKDLFKLDDPIIFLPCKHSFHPDCLIPWLKLNGTCPTCRFSLVQTAAATELLPSP